MRFTSPPNTSQIPLWICVIQQLITPTCLCHSHSLKVQNTTPKSQDQLGVIKFTQALRSSMSFKLPNRTTYKATDKVVIQEQTTLSHCPLNDVNDRQRGTIQTLPTLMTLLTWTHTKSLEVQTAFSSSQTGSHKVWQSSVHSARRLQRVASYLRCLLNVSWGPTWHQFSRDARWTQQINPLWGFFTLQVRTCSLIWCSFVCVKEYDLFQVRLGLKREQTRNLYI